MSFFSAENPVGFLLPSLTWETWAARGAEVYLSLRLRGALLGQNK